jgi:hypothetical protein
VRITNQSGINLPLAVWLLHDEYDYNQPYANYISATTLMRPIRQIVLPSRIPPEERVADVEEFIARSVGHALHDSMEKAWTKGYDRSLRLLGYPPAVIERIRINPTDEELRSVPDVIPIYLEQRAFREHDGFVIGGKEDMITEGIVNDTKSTSVWGWVKGTRMQDHILQMSLYRWIEAKRNDGGIPRITADHGQVNYIFTDWSKGQAKSVDGYPPRRVMEKQVPLLTLEETEHWVDNKLAQIEHYRDKPESQIPECNDEELWRSDPEYKYYADPAKAQDPTARSSKNFKNKADADRHLAEKGKGIVITKPGEVKACAYCPAFHGCTQKDRYQ